MLEPAYAIYYFCKCSTTKPSQGNLLYYGFEKLFQYEQKSQKRENAWGGLQTLQPCFKIYKMHILHNIFHC